MRILHIWNDYSPALFDHSHSLALERGWHSRVVAGHLIDNGASVLPETYAFRSRRPAELTSAALHWRVFRRLRRVGFERVFQAFCRRHWQAYQPDVVHVHFGTTAASIVPFLRETRTPTVVSFYGVDASAALRDSKVVARYRELFARASVFAVLADAVADRLVAVGCPRQKIHRIILPAGVEQYPLRLHEFDGVTRFLIAARFVEKKGHRVLLRAYRKVVDANPNVHLTMLGYGPSEWVEALVAQLRLGDKTTIINNGLSANFVAQFNAALADHDVFVAPSTISANGDDEAGPALTMVAAQSAGKAVIATPFVGAELSLLPGETGLYCEMDDDRSLAERMLEICAQPQRWSAMGERGSALVRERFSRESYAETLSVLYAEATCGSC